MSATHPNMYPTPPMFPTLLSFSSGEPRRSHEEEFNRRIRYNFKRYIVLYSNFWPWDEIPIRLVETFDGYQCYKVVRYGFFWYHLIVKFDRNEQARVAVIYLNNLSDFRAVLVDDMLRDWFSLEMRSNYITAATHVVVQAIRRPPQSENVDAENYLSTLFQDFGKNCVLYFNILSNEIDNEVLFFTMTEALAACIAFGKWNGWNDTARNTLYLVQIWPSEKEAALIDNAGGIADEALRLDYFVPMMHHVYRSQAYTMFRY